jgi:ABC-type lipoprotein export system ATPase subunit
MIETITLHHLLPQVFRGMEETETLRASEVWLTPELTLRRGCRLCIQAESGGGKSSLLSFLYGQRRDYDGRILFDGTDVRTYGLSRWCEVRTHSLALLPQEMRMFPELTVLQNLQLKNELTRHKTREQLLTLLDRLGIAAKANDRLGILSIGQQQRVALIRALCQPFDFILLDEPVSHLDRANNLLVAQIVAEEAAAQGAGIISTSVGNPLLLDGAEVVRL